MASSNPSTAGGVQNPKKSLGFVANAMKRKDSFFQFFVMTGILLLSLRSVGQKYRIHNLQEDTHALKEEQKGLAERMSNIKRSLLDEAALDPSGHFASRLRILFVTSYVLLMKFYVATFLCVAANYLVQYSTVRIYEYPYSLTEVQCGVSVNGLFEKLIDGRFSGH